jgi:septal ring-binding cell division protein DamX
MNTMEERYQKELFDEYRPKRHFPKSENIVPKTKFSLTLSLEKTVCSSIAIVMAMVVVYAFGVERGKVLQGRAPAAPIAKTIKSVTVGGPRMPSQQAPAAAPAPVSQAQAALSAGQLKGYTIVGATFTRKEWADTEVERLKKSGYEATVYQSSNFFLVCIGSYQTKDEAKLALSKIRSSYKDAYLRSR